MIGQPSLDRFSQPGPYERGRRGVKFLIETAECDVCGQAMSPAFLQEWNGQEVCKYCVRELEEEYERLLAAEQI